MKLIADNVTAEIYDFKIDFCTFGTFGNLLDN